MAKLSVKNLKKLAIRVLKNSNISDEAANSIADALVVAEADGIHSHGVSRLPSYCDQALSGKVNGHAKPTVSISATGALRVDAMSGFAYPAIDIALSEFPSMAGDSSIVGIAIANSHHAGVLGYHVERFAESGRVVMGFSNSPAAIAPWGGTKAIFGTNPIAFACPRIGSTPIIVDLSLSKVPRGRIQLAAEKGEKIPLGWAVDSDGKNSESPTQALLGTLLPIGDAKGAALALMVELLAAGMTGSNFGFEATSFFSDKGSPPHIGQFFILFDSYPFSDGRFFDRVENLCNLIDANEGARMPGSKRFANRMKHMSDGVEIPEKLIAELNKRL